jgi:hypothetical protein
MKRRSQRRAPCCLLALSCSDSAISAAIATISRAACRVPRVAPAHGAQVGLDLRDERCTAAGVGALLADQRLGRPLGEAGVEVSAFVGITTEAYLTTTLDMTVRSCTYDRTVMYI